MRSDEFISSLSAMAGKMEDEQFEKMRKEVPLGLDEGGNVLYAHARANPFSARHTCVTGGEKGEFIRRTLLTLGCLHEKGEICFFILSTDAEYAELLRMRSLDVTLPYIRSIADLERAAETIKELLRMREYGRGYPRLVLVLDGLENLEGCNQNGELSEYTNLIELLSRRESVQVITGVELTKSIFSGYPGAFVGVGNCLIATKGDGEADVTYVQEDASLTTPRSITYPASPALAETVLFFNSVSKE